jgi:hypothetical protein
MPAATAASVNSLKRLNVAGIMKSHEFRNNDTRAVSDHAEPSLQDPGPGRPRLRQINNLVGRGAGEARHISEGDCGGTAPNPVSISRIASFLFRACYPPVTSLIPPLLSACYLPVPLHTVLRCLILTTI